MNRTNSDIGFVDAVIVPWQSIESTRLHHYFRRLTFYHFLVRRFPRIFHLCHKEIIVSHSRKHSSFVATVYFPVIIICNLSDTCSAWTSLIEIVRIFVGKYFREIDSGEIFPNCNSFFI